MELSKFCQNWSENQFLIFSNTVIEEQNTVMRILGLYVYQNSFLKIYMAEGKYATRWSKHSSVKRNKSFITVIQCSISRKGGQLDSTSTSIISRPVVQR